MYFSCLSDIIYVRKFLTRSIDKFLRTEFGQIINQIHIKRKEYGKIRLASKF